MKEMKLLAGLCTGLAAVAGALAAPPAVEVAHRAVTNENGAFTQTLYRSEGRVAVVDDQSGHIALNTPRWIQADGGLAWIPNEMSLGDDGAMVFTGLGLNNESLRMQGTGSSQEVFDFDALGSEGQYVNIADHAGLAGGMVVIDTDPGGGYDFEATVHIFKTTSTGTPEWSYTFPKTLNYFGGGVAISDDGSRVLMWKADPNIGKCRIEAFDAQGNSISSGQLGYGTNYHSRQTRLSDDGKRAYLNIGTHIYIYDVDSASVLNDLDMGASFDSHAFSGDGKRFAYGYFGYFRVYGETSPGVWTQIAQKTFPGSTFIARCDLNKDGSRIGYLNQRYSPNYDHIDVGLFDVNAQSVLFEHAYDAPGTTLQMFSSGCAVDEKGDYVAGSSWGDSFNTTPEGFVFDAAGNATCEIDSRGSAFAMDLDSAGDVFSMGCKATHANNFGNGGDIIIADAYPQDLHVLGYAQAGGQLELRVARTSQSTQSVQVAVCRQLGNSNTPLGRSELDLSTLLTTIGPISIPNGGLVRTITVPGALAGKIVHLQGGVTGGNPHLTNKVSVRVQP